MEHVEVQQTAQGILQINLNHEAQLNALSHAVLKQLLDLFLQAKSDTGIKAILLKGNGKGFCAGADIKQLSTLDAQTGLSFARFGQHVFNTLELLGKPSLAAIHGFAFGGGLELAMAATFRIAADNVMLGQPEVKLGIIPGFGGTQRLARLIGKGRALEVCMTGRKMTATEALNWGLLTEIVAPENLLARAQAYLEEIVKLPPFALKSLMQVIQEGYDLDFATACDLEAAYFGLCCATKDKHEGVSAFLEKRTPQFSGA